MPKINPIEKNRQLGVLSPLLSYVAESGNHHYHEISELVSKKTEQIIHLANTTVIKVGETKISILSILADSAPKDINEHWAIEGHQEIAAVKEFALKYLTRTELNKL